MTKLSKEQLKERTLLINALDEAWDKLQEAIDAVNAAQDDIVSWTENIAEQMGEYFEDKSERWQEGDTGQAYQAWMEKYSDFSMDEIEAPESPDGPDTLPEALPK